MSLNSILLIVLLFIILIILLSNLLIYNSIQTFISNNKQFNGYRLGDIINGYIYINERNNYNSYNSKYPNSIASKYISKVKNLKPDKKFRNFDILYDILEIKDKPKNGINLHLRLGDILLNFKDNKFIFKTTQKYGVQPKIYNKLCEQLKKITNIREVNLHYGSHNWFNDTSYKYINEVKNIFKNHGFTVNESKIFNPDIDFIEMCKSDIFIQSFGGYSNFIAQIVIKNKGTVLNIDDFD